MAYLVKKCPRKVVAARGLSHEGDCGNLASGVLTRTAILPCCICWDAGRGEVVCAVETSFKAHLKKRIRLA
jgi:hypothetical protein